MEDRQIWLKPKPTHIDENFEDFLNYLRNAKPTSDTLYTESVRLLKDRVALLVEERTSAPIYRLNKTDETLTFTIRLSGAWLLTIKEASEQERKQVLLTLINCLIHLALQNKKTALNDFSFAYKNIPELLNIALRLATYHMPDPMPFSWSDLINFSLDIFITKIIEQRKTTLAESIYEGKGLMAVTDGEIILTTYSKQIYDKKYLHNIITKTSLLPEYGFSVSTDKGLQLRESQKDEIKIVEEFVDDILQSMKTTQQSAADKCLLHYTDGEYVPVEVVEVSAQQILLQTIDPSYHLISGPLVFEQDLKIFSKIYPAEVWAKVIKVGDRFNVIVNTSNQSFSLTRLFLDYIRDHVSLEEIYDAHNRKASGGWLTLREFWTNEGFMVFINLTEEENEQLDEHDRHAGIIITNFGSGQYAGCLYGSIYDYEVENPTITREEVCPKMLRNFIEQNSQIRLLETEEACESIPKTFIKEYCNTLNVLQSREVNPMVRYRILSVIRILCTLIESEDDSNYFQYLAQYIKTLILFAKADTDEGNIVIPINAPDDLKDEETVRNGADILTILACFAKGYDETSATLDPYIDNKNETLSKTASLVQSYNRLHGLLESKTLKGIKREILNRLSVVLDGDSTLELSNELEGMFGEEDDMKEFKSSFFEAPANAKEQRQFYNIFRGICAMMNNRGGVLYLGVNDKGIPVGVKNDLEHLSRTLRLSPTLDAYMLYISKMGETWFGETYWKYVTLKPISEHNVVSIRIEPYPYDIVYLKDNTTYLRKNNASAPITNEATIEDIRRRRQQNLRKTDDKTIILQDSIRKERKVRLTDYKSSNSGTIQNRIVEAFHIDNNEYIHCYEAEHDKVKLFRISRAEKIVMLDEPWEFKDKHKKLNIDPFHMSGDTKINVKLQLKLHAKNAIEECYPGITQYIKQQNSDTWMLETYTYNLYPLMLFYLSNAKYVDIISAKGLKEAVKEYIEQNLHLD